MSLPALPDIFGNYSLGEDFAEVVAPAAIDWLPQTPGWAVAAAVAVVWLARRAWRASVHWYRNRYRKEACRRLARLPDSPALLAEVNKLLKISAISAFSRPQVARLSGRAWPQFLNQRCPGAPFSPELCELLALGVYREQRLDSATAERLLAASRSWINQHRNRFDD